MSKKRKKQKQNRSTEQGLATRVRSVQQERHLPKFIRDAIGPFVPAASGEAASEPTESGAEISLAEQATEQASAKVVAECAAAEQPTTQGMAAALIEHTADRQEPGELQMDQPEPPSSEAIYQTLQELFQLARRCTLKERCYANDTSRMCELRDRIEQMRQNGSEFDSLAAEVMAEVVVQMKLINSWGDKIYDLYRTLDVIDRDERKMQAAAATMLHA